MTDKQFEKLTRDELREKMCKDLVDAGWKSSRGRWFLESFPPEANTLPLEMAYERMKSQQTPSIG